MIILSFLLTLSLNAFANNSINQLNEANLSLNTSLEEKACTENEDPGFTPHTFIDASKGFKPKFVCKTHFPYLTNEMSSYNKRFGQHYCKSSFGPTAFNCTETNTDTLSDRVNDTVLMKKITQFTKDKFASYKVELRDECCSNKSNSCYERFNQLNLNIKNSVKSEANYNFSASPHKNLSHNSIYITSLRLAEEYTQEGIERLLLHEMGHVCHVALASEGSAKDFNEFAHPDTKCLPEVGEKFFENFNPTLKNCLISNLKSQINKHPNNQNKYCYGKWYREAAAEMMFKHRMKSIYHWIKPTYSDIKPNKSNSSIYELHNCVEEFFPRSQLCES